MKGEQVARTRTSPRRVTLLLEGDVAELTVLRAGERARRERGVDLDAYFLTDHPRAGRDLVAGLAGGLDLRRMGWRSLRERLRTPRHVVFMAPDFWQRHGPALWPELGSSAVYVCRQGGEQVERVVVGADCLPTAVGLLGWIDSVPRLGTAVRTVVQAIPPPPLWATSLLIAYGVPFAPAVEEPASAASGWLVRNAPPEQALTEACRDFAPDLVVLGWHAHSLPLPARYLHPLAWRLSLRLPMDVLLIPLHG